MNDEPEATVDQIRRVLADPGSVIRRGIIGGTTDGPYGYEPMSAWRARALLAQFKIYPIKQRRQEPVQ